MHSKQVSGSEDTQLN